MLLRASGDVSGWCISQYRSISENIGDSLFIGVSQCTCVCVCVCVCKQDSGLDHRTSTTALSAPAQPPSLRPNLLPPSSPVTPEPLLHTHTHSHKHFSFSCSVPVLLSPPSQRPDFFLSLFSAPWSSSLSTVFPPKKDLNIFFHPETFLEGFHSFYS